MKKNKLFLLPIVCLLIFVFGVGSAFAMTVTVTKTGSRYDVDIDGSPLTSDVSPRVEDGVTLVPMRVIFEALNAQVDYNADNETVTAERDGTVIRLKLGSDKAYINNEEKILAVPAKLVDNRTLVPLRFVSEALGENVDYVVKQEDAPSGDNADNYYQIAKYMADAMDYDSKAVTALRTAYTYADYYKKYGDTEFLTAAESQYKSVASYLRYSVENADKASALCGSYSRYTELKAVLAKISGKYSAVRDLQAVYSAANLDKVIDYYLEVSELWNDAVTCWTNCKPQ